MRRFLKILILFSCFFLCRLFFGDFLFGDFLFLFLGFNFFDGRYVGKGLFGSFRLNFPAVFRLYFFL